MFSTETVDAHKALYEVSYDFKSDQTEPRSIDSFSITNSLETFEDKQMRGPISMLLSEGLRNVMSIDTTDERSGIFLFWKDSPQVYDTKIVGLMHKTGSTGFTSTKVMTDYDPGRGHPIHVTFEDFKILMDEAM